MNDRVESSSSSCRKILSANTTHSDMLRSQAPTAAMYLGGTAIFGKEGDNRFRDESEMWSESRHDGSALGEARSSADQEACP